MKGGGAIYNEKWPKICLGKFCILGPQLGFLGRGSIKGEGVFRAEALCLTRGVSIHIVYPFKNPHKQIPSERAIWLEGLRAQWLGPHSAVLGEAERGLVPLRPIHH